MNLDIKKDFIEKWGKYFHGNELPIACFYSDDLNDAEFPNVPKPNKHGLTCIFGQLAPVRKGKAHAFNQDNLGCWGSKGLLGFMPAEADDQTIDPDFDSKSGFPQKNINDIQESVWGIIKV